MMATTDRITHLSAGGFKSLENVDLDLSGLTVLIGENGSGKSTILDALGLVASAAERLIHVQDVLEKKFGRFERMLRAGSPAFGAEVRISNGKDELLYGFAIALAGGYPVIGNEWLYSGRARNEELALLKRTGTTCKFRRDDGSWGESNVGEQALCLGYLGLGASSAIARTLACLEGIEVHPPFDVRPIWQQRELGASDGPRWAQPVEPAPRLKRYGTNLASAFHELRNVGGETWERVLDLARLGLGSDLRDLRLPSTGRGSIELELLVTSLPQALPAEMLSDGQLSYLAFIALTELGTSRSVLAVDEPELHLHPALLGRAVGMLERAAEKAPVIVATHSDRLLDALSDPVASVVLCELDENRATRLRRLDPERLKEWLTDYRGLGAIRAEGYQEQVFEEILRPGKEPAAP